MKGLEKEVAAMKKWFESPRFEGIIRLSSLRAVAQQQGTIENDYTVARRAAVAAPCAGFGTLGASARRLGSPSVSRSRRGRAGRRGQRQRHGQRHGQRHRHRHRWMTRFGSIRTGRPFRVT